MLKQTEDDTWRYLLNYRAGGRLSFQRSGGQKWSIARQSTFCRLTPASRPTAAREWLWANTKSCGWAAAA